MNTSHYHLPGDAARLRQELEATERQVEILSDDLSKCSKAQTHAKLLTANDEALMRQALDAIDSVLSGADFDSPYADLKQAAAALKDRLK